LLAGLLALVCASAPVHAQNVALNSGVAALTRATDAIVALSVDGALSRSTTNGASFTAVRPADAPQALFAVAASGSTVVAMGDASTFVRSTNSGLTYSALTPAVGSFVGQISALSAQASTWVAVGRKGSSIAVLRSADSGATWAAATTVPAIDGQLHGVAFTGSRWLAVGSDSFGGLILTSTNGTSWSTLTTTLDALYAIATDGAGRVVVVGAAGTVLRATDGGATAGSFTSIGDNLVSEDLRSIAYLSGDSWIIGGDSGVLVSLSAATPALVAAPDPAVTDPVTALLWTGTGTGYLVSSPSSPPPPAPHGPISLRIVLSGGQLNLTLVGAEPGNTYRLETSATLASFSPVPSSDRVYSGGAAPSWTYPAPSAGGRVFYRALVGAAP
jgi:photosystem II stability/assembly factor-like uncharacterized protein